MNQKGVYMEKIKTAVIGAGFISRIHLDAWKRLPNVEVKAIVDVEEERAKKYAEIFGIPEFFTDYTKVIEDPEIDIIDVCTPTYTHAKISIDAMKSGKNVLLEKPIALKLRDADEIINTSKKQGVKFMVAHCLRFWPEYTVAKKIVDQGEIGEVRVARAYRLSPYPDWSWKSWLKDFSKSGGVFVDMSIHDVDFLRWIIGEVEEVYARGGVLKTKDATSYDYVHALLKFKNGAIAYVEGSWIQPKSFPFTTYLEIVGTGGALKVDNHTTSSVIVYKEGSCATDSNPISEDAYYLEIKHFVDSVIKDYEPMISGLEARKTLEVVLAGVKSIMENKPVRLPLSGEVIG